MPPKLNDQDRDYRHHTITIYNHYIVNLKIILKTFLVSLKKKKIDSLVVVEKKQCDELIPIGLQSK